MSIIGNIPFTRLVLLYFIHIMLKSFILMGAKILMNTSLPRLAIVIPCFNEQSVLPNTLEKLLAITQDLIGKNQITSDSFLYCVDDGSYDETWSIIADAHLHNPMVKGLRLSRNVGHQNALLAGLLSIKKKVDCTISIDADLQDDISVIKNMIEHYQKGSDIVYGVRKSRQKDTLFKRLTAIIFYKVMQRSGANILFNHADFRLLSSRTLDQLNQFKERNLFLRGIFPLIGFRSSQVYYDRTNRLLGESKYTIRKMVSLAWDGITSFSHAPLNFILTFGVISFISSLVLAAWALSAKLFSHAVPGWASIMIPLCFMGGVQLLSIGILGEYIAKIYLEVKRRPRYIKDTELL